MRSFEVIYQSIRFAGDTKLYAIRVDNIHPSSGDLHPFEQRSKEQGCTPLNFPGAKGKTGFEQNV